jgi:hypothetical protein
MGSMTGDNVDEINAAARYALSLLTMRVNAPADEWLPPDFEREYEAGWADLEAQLGSEMANEGVVLVLMHMAALLMRELNAATGKPFGHWLQILREEYVNGA